MPGDGSVVCGRSEQDTKVMHAGARRSAAGARPGAVDARHALPVAARRVSFQPVSPEYRNRSKVPCSNVKLRVVEPGDMANHRVIRPD